MAERYPHPELLELVPELLSPPVLNHLIYPAMDREYYFSLDWSPAFYVKLSRYGFITIATRDLFHGPVLLPEMQREWAVLHHSRLKVDRRVRKLLMRYGSGETPAELVVNPDPGTVVSRIRDYHGDSWLIPRYADLVQDLAEHDDPQFQIVGIELRIGERRELVAGELGYTHGATYTSLSGFFARSDPRWSNHGSLQLVLLSRLLRSHGLAFWNMGYARMEYKTELGAQILPRSRFLSAWLPAVRRPHRPLADRKPVSHPLPALCSDLPELLR